MPPEPQDTPDDLARLRQQLILAQMRIMELADARTEIETQLNFTGGCLQELQKLSYGKLRELDQGSARIQALEDSIADLQRRLTTAASALGESEVVRQDLSDRLASSEAAAAALQLRVDELTARLATLKASRSWRWTALLRSLERLFKRDTGP